MTRLARTLAILLVLVLLVVACGGDDDDDDGDGAGVTSTISSEPSGSSGSEATVAGVDTEDDEDTDNDTDDTGDADDEEGPRAELSAGSSGEVQSHDPDPMALDDSGNIETAPLKVTIVRIIDPATTDSDIFQPQPGNRYWAVEVLMEAVGDETVNTGEPWILTDTDGNEYYTSLLTGVDEDIRYDAIEAGQSVQGVVVFEIPESAQIASVSVNASIYVGGTLTFEAP
jgi:hypothetical protein